MSKKHQWSPFNLTLLTNENIYFLMLSSRDAQASLHIHAIIAVLGHMQD
jgi:hypothetical protein